MVDEARVPTIVSSIDRVNSDGLLEHITTRKKVYKPESSSHKITYKTFQGQSLLGRLLFSAAALYEAMDDYTDEKLIQKYLTAQSPLHPRRTLDQSCYWTLKDTRSLDKDQVVYRSTAPAPSSVRCGCLKEHWHGRPCAQCLENIKKVPGIVMVDQLWMWILDESKFGFFSNP